MRIHRLRLTDFRGVADREVVFADSGITVVHGPNEIGKSSLTDALDMLLHRHDSSTAQDVRAAVPAGRDVGPYVEVEMSTGSYRFVFAKRWLRDRMTSLDVLAPERRQLSGREAHDEVERMLGDTLDADLWAALRVAQGTADGPVSVHTRSLARVLDDAMDVEATSGDEDLVERIEGERTRWWTKTGKPRRERLDLARQRDELVAREAEVLAQIDALSHAAERVEELLTEREQLVLVQADAQQAVAEAERERAALDAARAEAETAVREVERGRGVHAAAAQAVDHRHELVGEVDGAVDELDKLRLELERTAAIAADATRDAADAAGRRDASAGALAAVEAELGALDARRELLDLRARLADLQQRRTEVSAALARRDAADERLAVLPPVDAASLGRIDEAATAVVAAEARLDGASAQVTVEAVAPATVEVGDDTVRLADETASWMAVAPLTVEVPGQVRVTVAPAATAAELVAAAEAARGRLASRCADVGVADLDAARVAHAERSAAFAEREAARSIVGRLLGSGTDADLDADIADLESRVARMSAADDAALVVADIASLGADDVAERLRDARARRDELRVTLDDLDADARHHRDRAERAGLDDATLHARIDQVAAHHQRLVERLATARTSVPDAVVDDALVAAQQALEAAELANLAAQRAVQALHPDQIDARLAERRRTAAEVAARHTDTVAEVQHLQGRLDAGGEQGLAGTLDEVRTARAQVEHELAAVERQAAAALLLHDTVTAHRDAARQRYAAPYRQELERLARLVFGDDLTLELDDDLRVVRRVLGGTSLDVAQLSVGAREQLALLARLACASIVSDDGAPVMFDDVLGHADPDRTAAMGRALHAAAHDGQIIITTCVPERYAGLDATRVSLV